MLPLGHTPPNKCHISKNDCPSHYLCIATATDKGLFGQCVCNRYYGFWGGNGCRKLSNASYMLVLLLTAVAFFSLISVVYNITLLRLAHTRKRMTKDVFISLTLNAFGSIMPIGMCIGCAVTVFEIDKNMYFNESVRPYLFMVGFAFFMLCSMGISINWIELVEKVRGRENQHMKYKCILYGCTTVWIFLVLFVGVKYNAVAPISLLGSFLIGYSFHHGGNIVVKSLRRTTMNRIATELSIDAANLNVVELSDAVTATSKYMTRFCAGLSLAFISLVFLSPAPMPLYPQQNSLPRICQGQFAVFLVKSREAEKRRIYIVE
jgi:hypothetical protein